MKIDCFPVQIPPPDYLIVNDNDDKQTNNVIPRCSPYLYMVTTVQLTAVNRTR